MPEVITSPAPLVGYNPPWLEPGQVKLEDVGTKMVNAFAKGVELNTMRAKVENQLAALSLRNQQLEASREHQGEMYDLAVQRLGMQSQHQGDMLDLARERLGNTEIYDAAKIQESKNREERLLNAYTDKVQTQQIAGQLQSDLDNNPYPAGSMQSKAYISKTKDKYYNTIGGTPEFGKIINQQDREHDKAALQMSKDAQDALKSRDAMIQYSPYHKEAFTNEDVWGTNKAGEKYYIRIPNTTDPQTKKFIPGRFITPKEEQEILKTNKDPGSILKKEYYHTPDKEWWDTYKYFDDKVKSYAGVDPSAKPSVVSNPSNVFPHNVGDSVKLKNGSTVTIKTINSDGTFTY